MQDPGWQPRRLAADATVLPEGVTPPGTRGKILHAALRLFAESGFPGGSIRAIAAAVGINSATLYSHFPSKEHVLAELVRIGHQELHDRLAEALATVSAAAPAGAPEQLAALVRAHTLVHTDYSLLAVVTNDEMHSLTPELAAASLELRQDCRQMLLDVLQRGVEQGDFRVPELLLASAAISAIGLRTAYWFDPAQLYTRHQVADANAEFALRIVGVSG